MTSAYFHMLFHNDRNAQRAVEKLRRALPFADYDDVRSNMPAFVEYMFTVEPKKFFHFTWSDSVYSFLQTDANVVTYEDLLRDTPTAFARALSAIIDDEPEMERVRKICEQFSFDRQVRRKPGEEDRRSFLRKGIAGDWREKFSREACEVFDKHAGQALIDAGYEPDRSWIDKATD